MIARMRGTLWMAGGIEALALGAVGVAARGR
jgi:hypothetical protein